jgi:hypothetical protein
MKAFAAVVQREIAERRLLGAAALLLGIVPLLLPFLPGVNLRPTDLRGGAALLLAALFAGGLALVLGATVVGRDLAERRMSFYFSRPVPGWAVWAGKIAAALLLTLGGGALVLLPAGLLGDVTTVGSWGMIGGGAAAALLLVPLSHAVAFLARTRTPWLLLDIAALFAIVLLVWVGLGPLGAAGAFGALDVLLLVMAGAAGVALFTAGAVQVAKGRTDTGRGHRLLSLTLWGIVLVALLACTGAARWVLRPAPSDLVRIGGVGEGNDRWVTVVGETAGRGGYSPAFLVDLPTGNYRRVTLPAWWNGPAFSRDGRRVVWPEVSWGLMRRPRTQLATARLDGGVLQDERTIPLADVSWWAPVALDPAGERIATVSGTRLLVATVPEGRLLASLPEVGYEPEMRFLDRGRLRIARLTGEMPSSWQIEVTDLEISTQTVTERARIRPAGAVSAVAQPVGVAAATVRGGHLVSWNVSPDGRRLAVSAFRIRRLYDAETGRELAALPGALGWGEFLADGRWLAAASRPGGMVAQLHRPDGTMVRSFRLPAGVRPQGEAAPGLVVLRRSNDALPQRDAAVFLFDLAMGRVRPLERGVSSAVANIAPRIGPESIASRLFVRGERELLLLEPASGGLKPVAFR